jgi:hypothetical protein
MLLIALNQLLNEPRTQCTSMIPSAKLGQTKKRGIAQRSTSKGRSACWNALIRFPARHKAHDLAASMKAEEGPGYWIFRSIYDEL